MNASYLAWWQWLLCAAGAGIGCILFVNWGKAIQKSTVNQDRSLIGSILATLGKICGGIAFALFILGVIRGVWGK